MEIKKTSKASLENERTTFFLLGFIVALSTLFVALEWRSDGALSPDWDGFSTLFIETEFIESPEEVSIEAENREANQPEPEVVEIIDENQLADEDFNVVEELSEDEKIEFDESEIEEPQNPPSIKVEIPLVRPLQNEMQDSDVLHTQVDVMPQFKGGHTELVRFIYNHLEYPPMAQRQRIQGRVWTSFIINKDGTVSDVKLEQGTYFTLDDEALRVLKTMPAWQPGMTNGEQVRVKIYLPVVFKL